MSISGGKDFVPCTAIDTVINTESIGVACPTSVDVPQIERKVALFAQVYVRGDEIGFVVIFTMIDFGVIFATMGTCCFGVISRTDRPRGSTFISPAIG